MVRTRWPTAFGGKSQSMLVVQRTNYRTTCSCRFLSLQQCQYLGRKERKKDTEIPKEHEKHLLLLSPVTLAYGPPWKLEFLVCFSAHIWDLWGSPCSSMLQTPSCSCLLQQMCSPDVPETQKYLWSSVQLCSASGEEGVDKKKNTLQEFDLVLASTPCSPAVIGTHWKVLHCQRRDFSLQCPWDPEHILYTDPH